MNKLVNISELNARRLNSAEFHALNNYLTGRAGYRDLTLLEEAAARQGLSVYRQEAD